MNVMLLSEEELLQCNGGGTYEVGKKIGETARDVCDYIEGFVEGFFDL